jgi:ribosomal protein L16/L10AE
VWADASSLVHHVARLLRGVCRILVGEGEGEGEGVPVKAMAAMAAMAVLVKVAGVEEEWSEVWLALRLQMVIAPELQTRGTVATAT